MISLAEIAKALDCDFLGNGNLIFSSPAEPLFAKKDQIAIALDKKFQPYKVTPVLLFSIM